MNSVVLIGRMAIDPELKTTKTGIEVTSFRIAVDRSYAKDGEKKADFIDVTAWKKTAVFVCQYFSKGKPIAIKGSLQTRSYETQDGSKRFVTEVLAESVGFVPNSKNDAHADAQVYSRPQYTTLSDPPRGDTELILDNDNFGDDLPF